MNIGEVARESGVPAKLIRYYESIRLVPAPARTASGYRVYTAEDVHTLRFVKQARSLGFSIEQIEQLLALWHDRSRKSAEVKALALEHVAELERKIIDLRAMAATLRSLAASCRGDNRPNCPILNTIARGPAKPPARTARTRVRPTVTRPRSRP